MLKDVITIKKAIIDIGSNSTRLLLIDVNNTIIKSSEKHLRTTRLGENVHSTKKLSENSINKTMLAIDEYVQLANKYNAETIECFATSATRDAKNGKQFVDSIINKHNINVSLIDGEKEANLAYNGALLGFLDIIKNRDVVVIDIGGGSTEVIQGTKTNINHSVSLDVGAVRLTGLYSSVENNNREIITNMMQFTDNLLTQIKKPINEFIMIGVAGTITSLAQMELQLKEYNPDKIQGYTLTKQMIDNWKNKLNAMTTIQRQNIMGLNPNRADIIPAGVIILSQVMEYINANKLIVSDFDNLEALALYGG